MHYFDHNATAPMLPIARQAWLEATEAFIGNPASPHRVGARAGVALDSAREKLARFLGCDPADIVWTSGATESNNQVLHHCARTLPAETEIWVSSIEHPSVLESARHYCPGRLRLIPADRRCVVDLEWLERELRKSRPGLIGVMAANNETGVLQPWREILALCRAHEIPYFCDAAQWIGKLPAAGLGACDFVTGCAHKFGGPAGVGFLKSSAGGRLQSLLRGGQQEEGRRAGTENVAAVVSMAAALDFRENAMCGESMNELEERRSRFERALLDRVPGTEIVGRSSARLWNTVSAVMPHTERRQRGVVKLDKLGFAVSTGSACASGREAPSHVLAAMGYSADETARALRFSSGWETTDEEWSELLDALVQVFRPAECGPDQLRPRQKRCPSVRK